MTVRKSHKSHIKRFVKIPNISLILDQRQNSYKLFVTLLEISALEKKIFTDWRFARIYSEWYRRLGSFLLIVIRSATAQHFWPHAARQQVRQGAAPRHAAPLREGATGGGECRGGHPRGGLQVVQRTLRLFWRKPGLPQCIGHQGKIQSAVLQYNISHSIKHLYKISSFLSFPCILPINSL